MFKSIYQNYWLTKAIHLHYVCVISREAAKTSDLTSSWYSIDNSTGGRMRETPILLTTTVTNEHERRMLASAALEMALGLEKNE